MSGPTAIEWTDASWNPVRGCSIVSPGCTNCYAMRQAHRHANRGGAYEGLTKMSKGGPVWTGKIVTVDRLLDWPIRRRPPSRIFVNSMSDLFHEDVPLDFIADVFAHMAIAHWHTFQVLTKRAARMLALLKSKAFAERFAENYERACDVAHKILAPRMNKGTAPRLDETVPALPLRNAWLGVSTERQEEADERIPLLLQTPAAVRWISAEPLLGPIDLTALQPWHTAATFHATAGFAIPALGRHTPQLGPRLDWVVAGGENGPRPPHPDWFRGLRDQCAETGVPFFFKQWGTWHWSDVHAKPFARALFVKLDGRTHTIADSEPYDVSDAMMVAIGKKAAGRVLDGREHNAYPHAA